MSYDIRPLRIPEEIDEARKLIDPGYAEPPNWGNVFGVFSNNKLIGIMAAEIRLHLEPMYFLPGHATEVHSAICWMDGFIRPVAQKLSLPGYSFFISDEHEKFQRFVEKHFIVTKGREKPGLTFFRKFE